MSQPLPRVFVEAAAANPAGLGLYSAARLIDVSGPSRIHGGLTLRTPNCGTAWGTWPTEPCADPVQEQQTITVTGTPTGGTFTLDLGDNTTAPIPYNATAAQIAAALEALPGVHDVSAAGGPLPGAVVTVTFVDPAAVPQMTADSSGLTGGTSPTVTIATTVEGLSKEGVRGDDDDFDPLTMWGYDECRPDEDAGDIAARALLNLRLHEEQMVEADFAARLLLDDGTPLAAATLVAAVGALEEAIGATGQLGVLHASRRFAALADQAHLILRVGNRLLTPLGHSWAFGGGYAPVLGQTLVMTGPVEVRRDPIREYETVDPYKNLRVALAERTAVTSYECFIRSATVA